MGSSPGSSLESRVRTEGAETSSQAGADTGITRRDFHRLGAAALVAAATPLFARGALAEDAKLVTEIPANEPLVTSLQYVHESEKPDQNCANCLLYTAGEGSTGKCQLFQQGVVAENGWCMSWSKKP